MSDSEYESDIEDDETLKANDLTDQTIHEKYIQASKIANEALKFGMDSLKVGAYIGEICKAVDAYVDGECQKMYKLGVPVEGSDDKKRMIKRGVAMPCCLAVNEVIGHFAPAWPVPEEKSGLAKKIEAMDKKEAQVLKEGDIVCIDLGCHIDGYIAQVAHTVLVTETKEVVTGKRADVCQAAWKCAEAAHRMIKSGEESEKLTEVFAKICKDYETTPMMGTMSCNMKRHIIDGTKTFPMSAKIQEQDMQHDPGFKFSDNHVFAVDIMVSTGEGKFHEMPALTTVFKRDVEMKKTLATPKQRAFYGKVTKQFPTLPFHNRVFLEDEKEATGALVGLKQACKDQLIEPYLPMTEKKQNDKGERNFTAQFKFTIGLFPSSGPKKLTGVIFDQSNVLKSEFAVKDEEALKVLALPQPGSKKKKKKAAKKD